MTYRLIKDYFGMRELRWSAHVAQRKIFNGCLVVIRPTDRESSFRYLFLFIMKTHSDGTMKI